MPSSAVLDTRTLRVGTVQLESSAGDKEANFRKIEAFARDAAARGVRLLVFPECCITGYWFIRKLSLEELAALAEPIADGASTRRLSELARELNITIGAGLIEGDEPGVFYNS